MGRKGRKKGVILAGNTTILKYVCNNKCVRLMNIEN